MRAFGRRCPRVFLLALLCVTVVTGTVYGGQAEKAKYVFLFIGDGMGIVQRQAAELYLAAVKDPAGSGTTRLLMNSFPAQGLTITRDLASAIPDSASTGTALSTGFKTRSGVIGMDADGKVPYETMAETAKKRGWKVGILTTVSLDHATPATFYAHVPSHRQRHDISLQMAPSGVDYFAGGQLMDSVGRPDPIKCGAVEDARKNGYTIAVGRAEFEALKPGTGKTIAMAANVDQFAAMHFTLDGVQESGGGVTLADYLAKGIEMLANPDGFFIMVEGGKIDWACHANDAAAAVHDTLAFDEAVARAVAFYEKHPDETLIVVTADHETGGLALGFAGTRYTLCIDKLQWQKMSYDRFNARLGEYKKSRGAGDAKLEDLMPLIREAFGLYIMPDDEKAALTARVAAGKVQGAPEEAKKAGREAELKLKSGMALSDPELGVLRDALKQSMLDPKERVKDDRTYLLYSGEEPLTVRLTTILNNKAGLAWTTYSHTGAPVQTSALGVGAEQFNGYYHQTEIHRKIMAITGLR